MFDNMLSLNESMVALYAAVGQSTSRGKLRNVFPRGAFACRDGYIALNVPDNIVWKRLCESMGREDLVADVRSADDMARADNADVLQPIVEEWLSSMTRAEAVALLNGNGVPTGPVNPAEDIFEDPHVRARGMLMQIEDPEVGEIEVARSPLHLSAAPDLPAAAAPGLGEHSRAVLSDVLGYAPDKIDGLIAAGAVEAPTP